jgi:hypothetical protein
VIEFVVARVIAVKLGGSTRRSQLHRRIGAIDFNLNLSGVFFPAFCCPALNVQMVASSGVPVVGVWERPRSVL